MAARSTRLLLSAARKANPRRPRGGDLLLEPEREGRARDIYAAHPARAQTFQSVRRGRVTRVQFDDNQEGAAQGQMSRPGPTLQRGDGGLFDEAEAEGSRTVGGRVLGGDDAFVQSSYSGRYEMYRAMGEARERRAGEARATREGAMRASRMRAGSSDEPPPGYTHDVSSEDAPAEDPHVAAAAVTEHHNPLATATHPAQGALVNGTAETLMLRHRPEAVLGLSSSDVVITEIVQRGSAGEGGAEEQGPSTEYMRVTVTYEKMSTPAMLMLLAVTLDVAPKHVRAVSSLMSTGACVTQLVLIATTKDKLPTLHRKLGQLAARGRVLRGDGAVDRADADEPDVAHAARMPYGRVLYHIPADRREGWLMVRDHDNGPAPPGVRGYIVRAFLRNVTDPTLLQENIDALGEYGAINYSPLPHSAHQDGLGWVKVAAAALSGNYKQACVLCLKEVGDHDKAFGDVLTELLRDSAAVSMRTVLAEYHLNSQLHEDMEARAPTIDRESLVAMLDSLPLELTWAGQLLYTVIADGGMDRFKRAWFTDIPHGLRRELEELPTAYVFNRMAAERAARYGPDPVVGDLVRTQLGAVKLVHTDDEAREYARTAIVLPYPQLTKGSLWAHGVLFPKNGMGQAAYEVSLQRVGVKLNALHPNDLRQAPGVDVYRPLYAKPFRSTVAHYEAPQGALLQDAVVASPMGVQVWRQRTALDGGKGGGAALRGLEAAPKPKAEVREQEDVTKWSSLPPPVADKHRGPGGLPLVREDDAAAEDGTAAVAEAPSMGAGSVTFTPAGKETQKWTRGKGGADDAAAVPPPPPAPVDAAAPPSDNDAIDAHLVAQRVYTRDQWSRLLLGRPSRAPPAPTPYHASRVCADCGTRNHPEAVTCALCGSTNRDGDSNPRSPDGSLHHALVELLIPAGVAIEPLLSEACKLHLWSGYRDAGSKAVGASATLLSFLEHDKRR